MSGGALNIDNFITRRASLTAAAVSIIIAVLTLTSLTLTSCSDAAEAEYGSARFFAMDTVIDVRLARTGGVTDDTVAAITKECGDIVSELEGKLSRTLETGPVYALNQSIDYMLTPDAELLSVYATASKLYELTDGAFSPVLGALTELWDEASDNQTVPSDEAVAEAASHTDISALEVSETEIVKRDPLLKLDFGGIGKGAAAQSVLEYLNTTGVAYGLVSMGGNVGVFGEKPDGEPFKIGVRDPDDAEAVVGYIYANAGFISVSGDYERFFTVDGVRYHHILDPSTGRPADNGLRSVAVWGLNGAAADALSTALFVMGVERGLEFYGSSQITFEAAFVTENYEIYLTDGLKDRFEAANSRYLVKYGR